MRSFPNFALVLVQTLLITLIAGACGARGAQVQATPTVDPAYLQITAVAAAFTVIAETQAAIPTSTPQPTATVTDTPAPTNTFLPLPSSAIPLTPGANGNGAADPCINKFLPDSLQGEPIRIRVDNPINTTLMLSVYLQQTGPGSECGYRSYALTGGQSLVINDLVEGCYTLWAWNPDPGGYFIVTNGTSCLDNSRNWTFDISTRSIQLRQ